MGEKGVAINNTNSDNDTQMMMDAYKLEIFSSLIEMGADINNRDAKNNIALHIVAESVSLGIIKLQLDKGMSVNLINTDKSTQLHIYAQFGHLEATKSLADKGADINYNNKYGLTLLTLPA